MGETVVALGVVLGFMLFMFVIFLMAEIADKITDWAWNKFSDWYLRRCDGD